MRVLCTSMGSPSHARAELPLARALAGAGHQVTVAATAAVAPVFAADDVTVRVCLPPLPVTGGAGPTSGGRTGGGTATARAGAVRSADGTVGAFGSAVDAETAAHLDTVLGLISGPYAWEVLTELRAVAAETRPDVIVRDGMDLAACLLAEERGVPQLPIPGGFANVVDPALVLPTLNELRVRAGLPVREDAASLHPHGRFDYLPAAYSFARHTAPTFAYRQTTAVERAAWLPDWVSRLPADRPLVFAAVGTALPMFHPFLAAGPDATPPGIADPVELLRGIVTGLSELDVTAVVATAGMPVGGARPGPHVHLTDRLPQPLVLECADLFVTHGGYNSVREALRTATPLVVTPAFGDQTHNARRVEELGLGRHVGQPDPAALAEACRALLDDRDTAARLRAARLATLGLPDVSRVAEDLAEVVAGHRVGAPRAAV